MTEFRPNLWQTEILQNHLDELNSPNYVATATLVQRGPLEFDRVVAAYRQLLERHTALSSAFVNGDHGWVCRQVALPEVPDIESSPEGYVIGPASFDVTSGPFLRVEARRESDDTWHITLICDHFVVDGRGMDIIVVDFIALYGQSEGHALSPAGRPAHIAEWQRSRLAEDGDAALDHWRALLGDYEPPFKPCPDPKEFDVLYGGSGVALSALDTTAAALRASRSQLLLWAFGRAVARVLGCQVTVVNTPTSGRDMSPCPEVVTKTANTIPVMVDTALGEERGVRSIARQMILAKRFEYYPFLLVEKRIDTVRFAPDRNPFFVFVDSPDTSLPGGFSRVGGKLYDAPMPISLFARAVGDEIRFTLAVNTGTVAAATMKPVLTVMDDVLAAAVNGTG